MTTIDRTGDVAQPAAKPIAWFKTDIRGKLAEFVQHEADAATWREQGFILTPVYAAQPPAAPVETGFKSAEALADWLERAPRKMFKFGDGEREIVEPSYLLGSDVDALISMLRAPPPPQRSSADSVKVHPANCFCDRCQGRPLSRSRKPAANMDVEARLKALRSDVVDYIDAGGTRERVVGVSQAALEDWFDALEVISGLIREAPQQSASNGDSKLPLHYEDGLDYCTVTDAQGSAFALTMQPELMQAMERALREDIDRLSRPPVIPAQPQTVRETDAYRDTVKKVAAGREKRLAELVEENAQLRAQLAKKRPQTLPGMIAEVYGELDAEDCAMVDREWARMRGYILPTNGTSTLTRPQLGSGK